MTTYINPEDFDPDLDDVPRGELGEQSPMYPVVLSALEEWAADVHGARPPGDATRHGVGTFLDLLAAAGYRVTPIDPGPLLSELLPPSTD